MGQADAIAPELQELVGATIAGSYRVDEVLGSGGMGVVFGGVQLNLKRPVAIKILDPEVSDSERGAKRFRREAESVARLDHRNCLQVFDFGSTEDGLRYMVMPRFRGRSLQKLLEDEAVSPRRALEMAAELLAGLEHAHAQGVVHRDLKPANIFVVETDDGQILKIVDFGIAKIVDSDSDFQTRSGVMFGTPAYMSPEQAVGEPVDARCDLYALGVVLYRMISGDVPNLAKTVMSQMRKRATLDIPPLPAPVPNEITELVAWLCERHIDKRCPDATSARKRLTEILDAAPREATSTWDTALPKPKNRTTVPTEVDRASSLTWLDHLALEPAGPTPAPVRLSRPKTMADGDLVDDEEGEEPKFKYRTTGETVLPRRTTTKPVPSPVLEEKPETPPEPRRRLGVVFSILAGLFLAGWGIAIFLAEPDPPAAAAVPSPAPPPPAREAAAVAAPAEEELDEPEPVEPAPPEPVEAVPPEPAPKEPGALELLARVNTRDRAAVLDYEERHAILEQLTADPLASGLLDLEANAVWDLEQAADAPQPCVVFAAALDRLDGARDRFVRRALRRARVPGSDAPACREAARKLERMRGSRPPRKPGRKDTWRPKPGEITPKLDDLKK